MFKSSQATQEKIERIASAMTDEPDGAVLTWVEIEQRTGVKMHPVSGPGRSLFRRALKKIRRPYETMIGVGVRLSSATSAMTIVRSRINRIDGAVRVADRTQRHLQERHLEQMSGDEQRKMLMAAGLFGAIRALARENQTKIFK